MKRNAQKDITRCICDFNPGIGDFICCDKCSVWQHMRCMGVHPTRVPKVYECEQCNPRPFDKEAAVQLQLMLRDEESSDTEDEDPTTPPKTNHKKSNNAKRSRKSSSNSAKSEDSCGSKKNSKIYKDVKDNVYSPGIKHRLELRTEGQPSFGSSPPGVSRVQPQAGNSPLVDDSRGLPAVLQVLNHGPAKIVITRQTVRPGHFISDYMGHFKRLSEICDELGGKAILHKKPLNYVLHYPQLDICVDAREFGTISRFVRRSCHPNAYIKSYLREETLHLGIFAKEIITSNSEITIAFNLHIDDYQFVQTCACSSVGCLVTKNNERLSVNSTPNKSRTLLRTESAESMNSDDDHKKQKLTREELKLQSYIQTIEKIEREEQRKRVLSENQLKSPASADNKDNYNEEVNTTPSRGGKRRRKGSGRKVRKPSGGSVTNSGLSTPVKSPEHFTFDPGVNEICNSPETVRQRFVPSPVYTVAEHTLSKHQVKYNGHAHDIHLRPMNLTPFSKLRRDLKLKNFNTLTPIKIQKDGFIVPIHGSLLPTSLKPVVCSYKTNKKRWLEHYIKEGINPTPESPTTSPKSNCLSPGNEQTPVPQVLGLPDDDLSAATRTLQLNDGCPIDLQNKSDVLDPADTPLPNMAFSPPANNTDQISDLVQTPLQTMEVDPTVITPESLAMPNATTAEKKKKVSLADYRKRLQSRSKPPNKDSTSSDANSESKSDKENSPRSRPVFEPISPDDSDRAHRSSLLEEFTRPSLSETVSHESIHPRKIRRIDPSLTPESYHDNVTLESVNSKSVPNSPFTTPPRVPNSLNLMESKTPIYDPNGKSPYLSFNGGNHVPKSQENSPSPGLSEDTFHKIKEILSQNNPSLAPSTSDNFNVSSSIVKTSHTLYNDSSTSSIKKFPYSSQFPDEVFPRDNKRLKSSSIGSPSDIKYYKESEHR